MVYFFEFWNRRGQAEMIGLVIIVIMITLGILFLAKFALQEDPSQEVFTRKGLAYSTMSAVMKTELECYLDPLSNNPVEAEFQADLLEDCAEYVKIGTSAYQCGEYTNSCDFLEDQLTDLLSRTLGEWSKNYVFSSVVLEGSTELTLIEVDNGGCLSSSERDSSGLFPIYVRNVGLIESVLYICD